MLVAFVDRLHSTVSTQHLSAWTFVANIPVAEQVGKTRELIHVEIEATKQDRTVLFVERLDFVFIKGAQAERVASWLNYHWIMILDWKLSIQGK